MLNDMRMSTACFARASQRWTSRLSKSFLLILQEVTPLSKTRNQLIIITVRPDDFSWLIPLLNIMLDDE